jgi:hypothetical protein
MNPKKDFKDYFEKVLGAQVEIQGQPTNPKEQERTNFINFIENYRKVIQRSIALQKQYEVNFYTWDVLFVEALENLINFTFDKHLSKLITWYVYRHPFITDEEEKIIMDPDDSPHLIENAGDLYELILLLEKY